MVLKILLCYLRKIYTNPPRKYLVAIELWNTSNFKAEFCVFNSILRQSGLIRTEFQLFRSHEDRTYKKN